MTRHSSIGAEWNVFDIEESFIRPKNKNGYIPPYIYLLILLILIGIAIGLYFLLRENNDDNDNDNDNDNKEI